MAPSSAAIRDLNDRFRNGDPAVPGQIIITVGVQQLLADHHNASLVQLIEAVRQFDHFDSGNDPYNEHDFGALTFCDSRLFWKIDYYAPDLMHGSEDPADAAITVRILTIMCVEEY